MSVEVISVNEVVQYKPTCVGLRSPNAVTFSSYFDN